MRTGESVRASAYGVNAYLHIRCDVGTIRLMDPLKILRERCGTASQKLVAEQLGISPAYLNDVLRKRKEPGKKILDALGLVRHVTYRRTNGHTAK